MSTYDVGTDRRFVQRVANGTDVADRETVAQAAARVFEAQDASLSAAIERAERGEAERDELCEWLRKACNSNALPIELYDSAARLVNRINGIVIAEAQ